MILDIVGHSLLLLLLLLLVNSEWCIDEIRITI